MVNAYKDAADAAGWVVAGCDKLSNNFEESPLEHQVEDELLNDMLVRIPHAPNKFFLGGFSGGAERAYHLSGRRREKIAGIIAMGGWLGGEKYQKLPYCQHMAVAMGNGKADEAAGSWVAKDGVVLRKRLCTTRLFPFDGGHQMPPRKIQDEVLVWLTKQTTDAGKPGR